MGIEALFVGEYYCRREEDNYQRRCIEMVGHLFPLGHLSTFAEKHSTCTWDFNKQNSTKTQETACPLNLKYDVIFCVMIKLQGALCGKATRNNIAYLGKRGQFVPQIDFLRK